MLFVCMCVWLESRTLFKALLWIGLDECQERSKKIFCGWRNAFFFVRIGLCSVLLSHTAAHTHTTDFVVVSPILPSKRREFSYFKIERLSSSFSLFMMMKTPSSSYNLHHHHYRRSKISSSFHNTPHTHSYNSNTLIIPSSYHHHHHHHHSYRRSKPSSAHHHHYYYFTTHHTHSYSTSFRHTIPYTYIKHKTLCSIKKKKIRR